LKNIQASVEKGRYREASDVYTDLSLVFWNALFYNEPDSQIAMDAGSLKVSTVSSLGDIAYHFCFFTLPQSLLEAEWTKRSVLPRSRTSPPPSSAQKVHGVAAESKNTMLPPPPAAPERTVTPAGQVLNTSSIQQHVSDPDVDITHDSDGSEEDEPAAQMDRDPQSDEIIKQLEKAIPGWPGFGEEGWMDEVKPVSCCRWNMHLLVQICRS
jgi:chromatin structure-remodeling complex subunit RSC1/2